MGKWKIRGCPRCGGSFFVDRDIDGWYKQCINCSYRNELKALAALTKKPVTKEKPSSMLPSSG